jgi:hypothetical protein
MTMMMMLMMMLMMMMTMMMTYDEGAGAELQACGAELRGLSKTSEAEKRKLARVVMMMMIMMTMTMTMMIMIMMMTIMILMTKVRALSSKLAVLNFGLSKTSEAEKRKLARVVQLRAMELKDIRRNSKHGGLYFSPLSSSS